MLFFRKMRHELKLPPPLSRMGTPGAAVPRRIAVAGSPRIGGMPATGRDAMTEPAQPMNGRAVPGRSP